MTPSNIDFELIIGATFGPYTYAFNATKSRTVGEVTVAPATNIFTSNAHGLVDTDQVRLKAGGEDEPVLPAPLAENVLYYVRDATTNTFKLSLTSGGAAIDILDQGAGVHTLIKRGLPLDLTGWTFWSWVKRKVEDTDASIFLDLAPTILSPASNGLVQIMKTDEQTHDLTTMKGFHSLLGQKGTGERLAFTRGKFTISKVSTHPAE